MKFFLGIIFPGIIIPLLTVSSDVYFSEDLLLHEKGGKTIEFATEAEVEDYYVPFEKTPDWTSEVEYVVGGLSAGDTDGDGDLDFAAGTYGGGYPPKPLNNYMFINNGNLFAKQPDWKTANEIFTTDHVFADFNKDGKLDLLSINGGQNADPNSIYFNGPNGIEDKPSWIAQARTSSIFGVVGDINQDGFLDFITGNLCYSPDCPGVQLIGYMSNGKQVETKYNWSSSYLMQNLGLALEDFDNDGLTTKTIKFSGDGKKKLFYLDTMPIRKILKIVVNGTQLPITDYSYDSLLGWVSLKNAPAAERGNVEIEYLYSKDLDLAVVAISGPIKFHLNEGGQLSRYPQFEIGVQARSNKFLRFVDIDNDGDMDLFDGGSTSPMVIYLNENGKFEKTPSWYSRDESPSLQNAAFEDFDKDGDLDLATVHFSSGKGVVRIYLNRRNILDTIPDWIIPWGGNSATSLSVFDANNDGKSDILVGYAAHNLELYLNKLK